MKKHTSPEGHHVLVFQGKEISQTEMVKLSDSDKAKVKSKVNGPHHDSKWAKHRRFGLSLTQQFLRPFGNHMSLRKTFSQSVEDRRFA